VTEISAGAGRSDRLRRADALIDLKRYEQALETLAPLLAGPGDGQALSRGARALIGLDRPADAVAMASRAVAASPDSEWAHRLRSAALMAQAKATESTERDRLSIEAREAARASVRLAPNLPVSYRNAVSAEIVAGDLYSASLAMQKLFELAPQDAETWNTASLLSLAQHQPDVAEVYARRAIEVDPNSSEAWNNLGVSLQRGGRMKDAVAAYLQSARLDPGESLTRRNIARSGLLVLRMIGLVALMPLLLVPDGVAGYVGLSVVAYLVFRPGGPQRDRAEMWGVRTAMRLNRMSFRSEGAQRFLSEVVTRVVAVGAILGCFYAAESTQPVVVAVAFLAVLGCVVEREVRGRFSARRSSR
jgi:tetratricopeptide (TPR) repeat protein